MKLLLLSLIIVMASSVYAGENSDNLSIAKQYAQVAHQSNFTIHASTAAVQSQAFALLVIIEQNKRIIELLEKRK